MGRRKAVIRSASKHSKKLAACSQIRIVSLTLKVLILLIIFNNFITMRVNCCMKCGDEKDKNISSELVLEYQLCKSQSIKSRGVAMGKFCLV